MIIPISLLPVFRSEKIKNSNRIKNNIPTFGTQKDNWYGAGSISQDSCEKLSYIAHAYNELYSSLDKKTPQGIKNIEDEFGNLTLYRGILFKNIDNKNCNISIKIPQLKRLNRFTKIALSDKSKGKNESFLIYNNRYVVKNYDCTNQNKIPEKCEFYTNEELNQLGINKKIDEIINKVDPQILRLRKIVKSKENLDLKPIEVTLQQSSANKISEISQLDGELSEFFNSIPHTKATKLRNTYKNYVSVNNAHSFTFKNLGASNLKINFTNLNNNQHGLLSRIMVFDEKENPIDGFLIKDNKIVQNFNPKNFAIIPPKLIFVNENEYNTPKYSKNLNEYIDLIHSEMKAFYAQVTSPEIELEDLIFSGEERKKIQSIQNSYRHIMNSFENHNSKQIFDIKSAYPDLEQVAGKRGFTFIDKKTNDKITIYQMQTKNFPDLLKITHTNPSEKEKCYLIYNGEKLVSNYNPAYTVVQEKLTFFKPDEFDLEELSKSLSLAASCLNDFDSHVQQTITDLNNKKIKKQQEKAIIAEKRKLLAEQVKQQQHNEIQKTQPKENIISETQIEKLKAKKYRQFTKTCLEEFKQVISIAPENLQAFNQKMLEIQSKVNEYINQMQNT